MTTLVSGVTATTLAAVIVDNHIVTLNLVDLVVLNLVGIWRDRSVCHATFWRKIPGAGAFAAPRFRKDVDFNRLQGAICSWGCGSADKGARLNIGQRRFGDRCYPGVARKMNLGGRATALFDLDGIAIDAHDRTAHIRRRPHNSVAAFGFSINANLVFSIVF